VLSVSAFFKDQWKNYGVILLQVMSWIVSFNEKHRYLNFSILLIQFCLLLYIKHRLELLMGAKGIPTLEFFILM